jgi:hypothetical protein
MSLRREALPELFINFQNDDNCVMSAQVSLSFHSNQTNQWSLLRNFLESVDQAGKLYELLGDNIRAQIHFKIGLYISKALNAPNLVTKFLMKLVNLESRCRHFDECKLYLSELEEKLKKDSLFIKVFNF